MHTKKYLIKLSYLYLTVLLFSFPIYSEILIHADDTLINYYGRFDFSTSSVAKFNWSGSTIEATFSGPSIGIALTDGHNDYDIDIDSKHDTTLVTDSGTSEYSIAANLSGASHTIRITQRSESHWNAVTFGGFYIADNYKLLTPPKKPGRKIEFIGDSWTAGYGNESSSRTCSSLRTYTNANKSFSRIITDAFHAQSIALGWSGQGMVRNYGDAAKKSSTPYPYYYNRTLGALDGVWDFSKWIPDLVVIFLGINDFSTTPYPDDTMYYNAYHAFVNNVRTNYPEAPILCISAHTGPMDTYVKKIVKDELSSFGRSKIYYAETPASLSFNGCDWHPTISDDTLIAKAIIDSIKTGIGWDTAAVPVAGNESIKKNNKILNMQLMNNRILFSTPYQSLHSELGIFNLSGSRIHSAIINGSLIWNISDIPAGVYMVRCRGMNLSEKIIINKR